MSVTLHSAHLQGGPTQTRSTPPPEQEIFSAIWGTFACVSKAPRLLVSGREKWQVLLELGYGCVASAQSCSDGDGLARSWS